MISFTLEDFVKESNWIEGIIRDPSIKEMDAHRFFLSYHTPSLADLQGFVSAVQPNAVLRDKIGLDVTIRDYIPPLGGPKIEKTVNNLLNMDLDPHLLHIGYERIHPFTDGNGRSGRVLWLHKMGGIEKAPLGFLQTFYYQTLVRR